MEAVVNESCYLSVMVTDSTGNGVEGLEISYSVRRNAVGEWISSGQLGEVGGGLYDVEYIFLVPGWYSILYSLPPGFPDSLEQIYARETALIGKEHTQLMSLPTLVDIEASTVLAKQADLTRTLGLMQENFYMDQCVYTEYKEAKLLASARIRTYSNAESVGTDSNVLATYQVVSEWSNGALQSYKVIKQ